MLVASALLMTRMIILPGPELFQVPRSVDHAAGSHRTAPLSYFVLSTLNTITQIARTVKRTYRNALSHTLLKASDRSHCSQATEQNRAYPPQRKIYFFPMHLRKRSARNTESLPPSLEKLGRYMTGTLLGTSRMTLARGNEIEISKSLDSRKP